MTDGKYCSLTLLKQYLIGTTATQSGNTTVFNGNVANTPDDTILSDAILQAEATFEQNCGTGFDEQTFTTVQAFIPFVDANGWLHLYARERGPVTAVSALQIRNILFGGSAWQTITWDATDGIILPPYSSYDTHPLPESWHVQIYPAQALPSLATGQILARWTYTGGFHTIPSSLSLLIARMASFIYKMREAPIGKVVNLPLGTMTVPADFPPDLLKACALWRPVYP